MKSKPKKFLLAVFVATLVILVAVWAANGYEDTWLYIFSLFTVLSSWFYVGKENNDQ